MAKRMAMLLIAACGFSGAAEAGQLDRRFIGAWAQSASDCAQVFDIRGGRAEFRKPVNTMNLAFIIYPGHVVASTGDCKVGNVVAKDGGYVASLSCSDQIGYLPVTARLKVLGPNSIKYGAMSDPLMDSTYARCH